MIRAALLLLCIAMPAAAQDTSTPISLLNHFTTRCAQIGADPATAKDAVPGSASVASGDGRVVIHYEAAIDFGNMAFHRFTFDGGVTSTCSLLLQDVPDGRYNELGALIAANAQALLGPDAVAYGDATPGGSVQMVTTPGYPPAALLTHAQGPSYVELTLVLNSTPFKPAALHKIAAPFTPPIPTPAAHGALDIALK